MRWRLSPVGKPALAYARLGAEEYLGRLRHYAPVELRPLRAGDPETVRRAWGQAGPREIHLVLDERGVQLGTRAFADRVRMWMEEGVPGVTCWIGGAEGHPPFLREKAHLLLGLSRFTLQHELALLMFLEQLYRVHTLLRNEPYHRD